MYFTPEKVKNSAQNKYLMLFSIFLILLGSIFRDFMRQLVVLAIRVGATYRLRGPMAPQIFFIKNISIYVVLNLAIFIL